MGVIIVSQGGGGGGGADHTHNNLATLNTLMASGPGELSVSGVKVGEKAIEISYEVVLTETHVVHKSIELPEDCDTSRALTLILESLPMRKGDDWEVVTKDAPVKDFITWAGLGMEKTVKPGDKVSITYYKKK